MERTLHWHNNPIMVSLYFLLHFAIRHIIDDWKIARVTANSPFDRDWRHSNCCECFFYIFFSVSLRPKYMRNGIIFDTTINPHFENKFNASHSLAHFQLKMLSVYLSCAQNQQNVKFDFWSGSLFASIVNILTWKIVRNTVAIERTAATMNKNKTMKKFGKLEAQNMIQSCGKERLYWVLMLQEPHIKRNMAPKMSPIALAFSLHLFLSTQTFQIRTKAVNKFTM